VGSALGLEQNRTPLEVWRFLTGRDGEKDQTGPMARGSRLEEPVIELYEDKHGQIVRDRQATLADERYPYLRAHCDGVLEEHHPVDFGVRYDGPGIFEVKCPGYHSLNLAVDQGLPRSWIVQMQVMLELAGCNWGRYAVYDYEAHDVIVFDVKHDPDGAGAVCRRANDWYVKHVLGDTPPDIDEDPPPQLPRVDGLTHHPEGAERDQFSELMELYLSTKQAEKVCNLQAKAVRDQIAAMCGERKKVVVDDVASVTRSKVRGKPKVDTDRLMRWAQSLYEAAISGRADDVVAMARHASLDEFTQWSAPSERMTISAIGDMRKLLKANEKEAMKNKEAGK
jgi:predicted phage-related endonuclease